MSSGKYLKDNKTKSEFALNKNTNNKSSQYSYTSNASPAPIIKRTPPITQKATEEIGQQKTQQPATHKLTPNQSTNQRTSRPVTSHQPTSKINGRMNFSGSVSKDQKDKKARAAAIDWERESRISVKAAERDGLIDGMIVVFVMAMFFCCYMMLSKIFPGIGPDVVSAKAADAVIGLVFSLISGCFGYV